MGILLGKFVKTENNGKSVVKQTKPSFFGSVLCTKGEQTFNSSIVERNLKIISNMKSNGFLESSSSHQDNSVTTPSSGWNFEDEYKFYLKKSVKKKYGSDNVPYKRKLRKFSQEQSDSHHSLACHVPIDKIQISPNNLKNFSENFNKLSVTGKFILSRLPDITLNACIEIDHNKSLSIQNTEAKIRTRSRSNIKNNVNNEKSKNLQLMQLTSEPRVVLDQTIVYEYLEAKRKIDRILRSDRTN